MSDMWTMPSTSPSRPTNKPNSVEFLTSPSTTEPTGCASAKASHGFDWACFRPRLMRRFSWSTSSTFTSTSWLVLTILPGCTFFLVQLISDTWTSPSMPGSSSTKAPYSVMLVTRPRNVLPTAYLVDAPSHGSLSSCFMPSEMRCVSLLMRMICTFTVSPMPSTSDGWLTRLYEMSVTWSSPSMPPRSTNAP